MSKIISRRSFKFMLGLIFAGFFSLTSFSQGDAKEGEKLFKQNCAACHAFDKKLTGPALSGVMQRAPGKDWLKKWIKSPATVIKSGDPYAAKLLADHGGVNAMSEFGFLTDPQLDAIIAYLEKGPSTTVTTTATTTTGGGLGGECPPEEDNTNTVYFVLGSIVLLILFIGVFRQVRISLQNEVNRRKGRPEAEETTFWQESKKWMGTNRRFMGVVGLVLVLVGMRGCWNELWDIGVYAESSSGQYALAEPCRDRTYKPEQPIKFSHKIHAGDNEIACQYCHSTVEKSKHAGIPTVNTCMNCHKGISSGANTGETEIAKIYAAAGFNPKTMNYESPQNPIKWIKVHNLPDHVSFSHVHHVVVAKQDCSNCHGDVKKMSVVEQVSPLTMGWCIDCHRKTEVPGLKADPKTGKPSNPYYQRIHEYYADKYKGQKVKLTVEKIGGLDCAKCHY